METKRLRIPKKSSYEEIKMAHVQNTNGAVQRESRVEGLLRRIRMWFPSLQGDREERDLRDSGAQHSCRNYFNK